MNVAAPRAVAKPITKAATTTPRGMNSGLGLNKNSSSGGSIQSTLSKKSNGPSDLSKTSPEAKQKVDEKRQNELIKSISSAYDEKETGAIEQQRQEFLDARKEVGPERMERLQKMMDKFGARMDDRGEARMAAGLDEAQVDAEFEEDVANTYKHLAELASAPDHHGPGRQQQLLVTGGHHRRYDQ